MTTRTLFITATFLLSPFIATAQLPGVDLGNLTISPQNPGPNQLVTAKLNSNVTDLNRADITWSVNGQTVQNGKGMKVFTFTAGNLGTRTTLEVMMVSSEGYPWTQSITLSPAKVDLLVEALSYTPPFYRGKAYFPYQGQARVVAVPSFVDENGKQIPPERLVFKWKEGERNLVDSSGAGRNILIYKGSIPIRSKGVSVEVTSLDQQYVAEKTINVTPTEPKIVLYEDDPEYGVLYNRALSNPLSLNKEQLAIAAAPYYFNTSAIGNISLKYEWNLNGTPVGNGENSLVLHNPGGGGGTASLSLQLSNTVDYFQFASASLNINFGTAARSLFGL